MTIACWWAESYVGTTFRSRPAEKKAPFPVRTTACVTVSVSSRPSASSSARADSSSMALARGPRDAYHRDPVPWLHLDHARCPPPPALLLQARFPHPPVLPYTGTMATDRAVEQDIAALHAEGFVVIPDLLSADQCSAMRRVL